MTSTPGDRYRVSCPQTLLDKLRRWGQVALQIGLGEEYAAALRQIQEHLETAPLEWGTPQYSLPHLDLRVFRGVGPLLLAWYGVHSTQRVVFLKSFRLVPETGLHGACEEQGLT